MQCIRSFLMKVGYLMKSMEHNTSWLSRMIRPTSTRIIPGMGLSLGITIALLSICIIIPLGTVFSHGLSLPWDTWKVLLTKANVVQAFETSLLTASIWVYLGLGTGALHISRESLTEQHDRTPFCTTNSSGWDYLIETVYRYRLVWIYLVALGNSRGL